MSSEHAYEQKGKIQSKPAQESAESKKDEGSLTTSQMAGKLDANTLRQMQQTVGNAAVQRFLAQRSESGPTDLDEETASTINSQRGAGHALDTDIAEKAGGAMGQDFSDVNVHTDSQADELSQSLGATAFTTGNDIFFREGAYNPGSGDGQRLISHELTHVVQQGGSVPGAQGKMTVNDPNDQFEAEADSVADTIMNKPDESSISRESPEEQEEMAQTKLQRQEELEDEDLEVQTKLQRQEELEDEDLEVQTKLQRQEVPEDEEI
jgi:hypothetical protein